MKRPFVLVLTALLILPLGLCGCDTGEFASVGDVRLVSAGKRYAPLENFLYSRNKDGLFADGMRKQPQEVARELDAVPVSDDMRIPIRGRKASSCYTLYDERYQKVYDCQEAFALPEEPGSYVLCVNVTWGTKEVYEGLEYFFLLEKE